MAFFPTFSWIPHAYIIRLDTPALTLFVGMSKIGMEILHQVGKHPFINEINAL